MFGIIAGVLIGVWAMYTVLSEDVETQSIIAEIQIIREAAVQWKATNGNMWSNPVNRYSTNDVRLDKIAPYASKAISFTSATYWQGTPDEYIYVEGVSVQGGPLHILPHRGGNARLFYSPSAFKDVESCARVLQRFGEIERREVRNIWHSVDETKPPTVTETRLLAAVHGYATERNAATAGCTRNQSTPTSQGYSLSLLID